MDDDYDTYAHLENELSCPHCGGDNFPISSLGSVIHYSCRWCGIWYSLKNEELEIGEFQRNG